MKRAIVIAVLLVALVTGAVSPAVAQGREAASRPSTGKPSTPPRDLEAPRARQIEGLGIRVEEELGTPDCPQEQIDKDAEHCQAAQWLTTRSPNFVNITKRAYLRGNYEIPQGVQMTSSFVASQSDTNVAITFSGEAYVSDDLPGTNRRLFVQAVVDGAPVDPADVVFAVGAQEGTRAFVFTTNVDAGIHTVEMRWRVDERATAHLRDASLLVQMGRDVASNRATLVTVTPDSGPNQETKGSSWSPISELAAPVYVGSGGVLTATMSAETAVTNQRQAHGPSGHDRRYPSRAQRCRLRHGRLAPVAGHDLRCHRGGARLARRLVPVAGGGGWNGRDG